MIPDQIKGARWNGVPCIARHVRIIVGRGPHPSPWYIDLVGTERAAIAIKRSDRPFAPTFYLDNEDGSGLRKITTGHGSPQYGHKEIYPEVVLDD